MRSRLDETSRSRRPPLVVVEGSDAAFARARADLTRSGWTVVTGWARHTPAANLVLCGTVHDTRTAGEAVLAALRGNGVLIHARAERMLIDRLCDDLRHLGRLDHRIGELPEAAGLTEEQHEVLRLLSAGASIGDAATALHLSRRSIDRRLAGAKALLGAPSTAAALSAYARMDERND